MAGDQFRSPASENPKKKAQKQGLFPVRKSATLVAGSRAQKHGRKGKKEGKKKETYLSLRRPHRRQSRREIKMVTAALFRENRREGEGEEADDQSQGRRGILIGNPRTPRGPRSPNLLGTRRRRRLLPGVFFLVLLCFSFFFFFILMASGGCGLGYNIPIT